MSDPAIDALLDDLGHAPASSLWLAGPGTPDTVVHALGRRADMNVVSNCFDVYLRLQAAGARARYSDFELTWPGEGQVPAVYLRIAKEKALTHYLLNRARRLLAPGGRLHLAGLKQEGIKGYIERASGLCGPVLELGRGGGGMRRAVIGRGAGDGGPDLNDNDYTRLRPVPNEDGLVFLTKPGLFGWNAVDAGSRLLVEALAAAGAPGAPPTLDLGCGYGYLTVHAARLGAPRVVATDSNAAALLACRANVQAHGVVAQVLAGDCADTISERFERVVCNPPFHEGHRVQAQLTGRFVAAARRLLLARGEAWFVVNRFIPLPRHAAAYFGHVETAADDGRYRVYRCLP